MLCLEKQTNYVQDTKPILVRFLTTTAVKRLIIDILRETICKQTTNTLDDKAVDLLEQQLFPKLN